MESVMEAQPATRKRGWALAPFKWDSAKAKLMCAKSHEVKRQRKQAASTAAQPAQTEATDDGFRARMLSKVRMLIPKLWTRIDGEQDAGELSKLWVALGRAEEVEARLSGRKDPGTEKPGPVQAPSRSLLDGPL